MRNGRAICYVICAHTLWYAMLLCVYRGAPDGAGIHGQKGNNMTEHRKYSHALFATGVIAAAMGISHSATAIAAAITATTDSLEEVVVTAERREQSLQHVPVAVVAVQPDEMLQQNVKDFINFQKVVPQVNMTQAAGQTGIEIRGVVTGSHDPTDESPNAIYIDGNYIARQNIINGMFFDIQRVEVLLGPQGTLYGRNAAGGAINIITNKPVFEYGGHASVEFGNYNQRRFEGAVNVPVSDSVALRFAGMSYSHDGYYDNGLDDANQQAVRAQALWKLGDRQSLLFYLDSSKFSPRGQADNIVAVGQGSILTGVPPLRDNSGVIASAFCGPYSSPACAVQTPAQTTGTVAGSYGEGQRSFTNLQSQSQALQYDYSLDWATLTLQAAHRRMTQSISNYGGGGLTNIPEISTTNTAELRLTSAGKTQLQYVAGLYYFDEDAVGTQQTYFDITSTMFQSKAFLHDVDHSWAAFGQLTYTPAAIERLHLTLGGRYNHDHKTGTNQVYAGNPANPTAPLVITAQATDIGTSWHSTDYRAGIAFDLTPQSLLYVNRATGSKSGGVAFGPFPFVPPEKNSAWEIGSKNRFLNGRLQVNFNAFDYKFLQPEFLAVTTAAAVRTLEVITADYETMRGAEMDIQYLLTPNDKLSLNANYLRARIHELNQANPIFQIAGGLDLKDVPVFNSPQWTGRGGYTHSWNASGGRFDATLSAFYVGSHAISYPTAYAALQASPFASIRALASTLNGVVVPGAESPSATVLDVSLRYTPVGSKWDITGYVNNVTDKAYWLQGTRVTAGNNPLFNTILADPSPPRTYGLILSARF